MTEYLKNTTYVTFFILSILTMTKVFGSGAGWFLQLWYNIIKKRKKGPIYFSNIFISCLGLAYFSPLGWPLRFKFFCGTLVGPLTLLQQKMELLRCTEPRELETMVFLYFTRFYDYWSGSLVLATSQKKFDLRRSPKVGQMRIIPNSGKRYLKNKFGPLYRIF